MIQDIRQQKNFEKKTKKGLNFDYAPHSTANIFKKGKSVPDEQ